MDLSQYHIVEKEVHLVKPSEQLVHSLGSEVVIPGVSVDNGVREP